ncbi:hypothetical protein BV20DRAFT_927240, partial [Pilatotrama ljubarskyi]
DGVHVDENDDFDAIFGDGSELAGVDLLEDSALNHNEDRLWKTFHQKLNALALQTCMTCHERDFDLNLRHDECARCRNDKGDPVKKFSTANNMIPAVTRPLCLQNLTDMEEMLIARVLPMMQVRYTRG